MVGVVRNWRAELVEAYPDLFHPSTNNPGVAAASLQCDEGWNDLLQRACVRIRAAVQADGGTFKFTQIKEKYGTARLYWQGALSKRTSEKAVQNGFLGGKKMAPKSSVVQRLENRVVLKAKTPGIESFLKGESSRSKNADRWDINTWPSRSSVAGTRIRIPIFPQATFR